MTTLTGIGDDSDGVPEGEEDTARRAEHPEPKETRQAMTKESRSAGGKVGFMTVELDLAGGGRQGKERGER
jgi:hypothetical protein